METQNTINTEIEQVKLLLKKLTELNQKQKELAYSLNKNLDDFINMVDDNKQVNLIDNE